MNERNLKDLINCDSTDKEKMMEAAKEKLRWYTFEASEEEFDIEAVDALVKFLREAEPEMGKDSEKTNDEIVSVQKRRAIQRSRGKIAAAVIISVLALTLASTIVGNSLGTTLAWEESGFFRWLKRDKDGQTMITSPEDLGIENGNEKRYTKIDIVPKEYQSYVIETKGIRGLEEYEIQTISIYETDILVRISEQIHSCDGILLEVGSIIYKDELVLIRDSYDDLQYQYSKQMDGKMLEIYSKETLEKEIEHTVFCCIDNKKLFVTGNLECIKLESIILNYVDCFLENNVK